MFHNTSKLHYHKLNVVIFIEKTTDAQGGLGKLNMLKTVFS